MAVKQLFPIGGESGVQNAPQGVQVPGPETVPFCRAKVRGKFIYFGEEKFYACGVTYGTFSPSKNGHQFPPYEVVDEDFSLMRENNVNCVRVYTVPPLWLLDCAQKHGLRVMVGLPWEQHIVFLDDPARVKAIEDRMRREVRGLRRHSAILMYAIGNEIPPRIVRWYGRKKIETFLKRLYRAVKEEDSDGLVTYINFPTTEYLQLNFLDIISYNVYLEKREILEAYLARLHNLTNEKPIVMAEIGLDSRRHGQQLQAETLDWQIKSVFASGCAGVFIFAWTDQWYRGGRDIDDWDFGLITRDRQAKVALSSIKRNFTNPPFPQDIAWPKVSVFVCSYNGSRTIRKTLTELSRLHYPDYEIVVVNDGSKDQTPGIAREFDVRLINTENRGLSLARNEALKDEAAEIVAYIDDDAYPDQDWLKYIVYTFLTTDVKAVGGPNLLPLESGIIENCVENAPGGATHVLIDDRVAEHIPGCNMAYRKSALKAIGGFDGQFRAAGDDVDLCWRIQERGWKIGYHPAAFVWHWRRKELRTYWRQQLGYGKAEALLEDKWPDKYNAIGHIPWSGRLYGRGLTLPLFSGRWRVYQGPWGMSLFQSIYQPSPGVLLSLPLMPEWYLLIAFLGILSVFGIFWPPLFIMVPFFTVSVIAPVLQAIVSASRADFTIKDPSLREKLMLYGITALLHLVQPLARLRGRMREGLMPFKSPRPERLIIPQQRVISIWQESWQSPEEILGCVYQSLCDQNVPVHFGNSYDNWDIEVRGGLLGAARLLLTLEEHGQGKQMLRFRIIPNYKIKRSWAIAIFALVSVSAGIDGAWSVSAMLLGVTVWLSVRLFRACSFAKEALLTALEKVKGQRIEEKRRKI